MRVRLLALLTITVVLLCPALAGGVHALPDKPPRTPWPDCSVVVRPTPTMGPNNSPAHSGGKETQPPPGRPGDINCDGLVNIDDILLLRDLIFGKQPTQCNAAAIQQISEDGKPTINVIITVRDIIFGIYTS
ncbi:MAG: hypothetical protein FWD16_06010 [Clostridia bacterium]|nr:hypothetical protein [Clostridia bacterium]